MEVTQDHKVVASSVAKVFGADRPPITQFWDDNWQSSVLILEALECPIPGVISVGTIGVSDHSINRTVDNKELRVEFVGACASDASFFPDILSTCAFCIINSHYRCGPGAIFDNVIAMYGPVLEMKHVLLVPPFTWDTSLGTLEFSDKVVTWLQVIPISENERLFALSQGSDALEDLLEDRQIDVYDLYRPSVL